MSRQLNLVKRDFLHQEKRVFPRFPYSFLAFKVQISEQFKTFQVVDISKTGMRIALKDGELPWSKGDEIKGVMRYPGSEMNLAGTIRWKKNLDLGIEFHKNELDEEKMNEFFSFDRIIEGMRPIHALRIEPSPPPGLKYWLRADGPVDVYIWEHGSGGHAKFQIIFFDSYIEWEDGKGVNTGTKVREDFIDSPLSFNEEMLLDFDDAPDINKINKAIHLVEVIPKNYLPKEVTEFINLKLYSKITIK